MIKFVAPYYFFFLLLLIPYALWYVKWRKKSEASILLSDTSVFTPKLRNWKVCLVHVPFVLRCLLMTLLVIILARPQTSNSWKNTSVEGINIIMAMDVSTSMLAEDFRPNRIDAAKKVAAEFISDRPNDNIGLVVFAGESFTQCPMTTDHSSLLNLLNSVRTDLAATGQIEDGTALGMGLANAIGKLKNINTDSTKNKIGAKVVILLTDGSNNRGEISPLTAAEIAKSLGVRIYTIAIGKEGIVNYPMMVAGSLQYVPVKSQIDEQTLREIAKITNGKSYRARNAKELQSIYKDIDKLEKTKFNVKKFDKHYDCYQPFAIAALIVFILELLLRLTILKRIP